MRRRARRWDAQVGTAVGQLPASRWLLGHMPPRPCVAAAVTPVHPFAAPPAPWARCHGLPRATLGWYLPRRLPTNLLPPVPAPPAALPRQREEEEAAVGQGRCQEREWEWDTSGATARAGRDRTGQEGSAVPPTSCVDGTLMAGRSGRRVLEEKRWQSLEEEGSAGTRLEHPTLARSKTCDPPFCEEPEPAVAAVGRQGHPSPLLSKHAAGYRKAFGELAEREALLACFSCAWQKEVPYHGRLYISSHHICFHASLLLKDIKVVVPIASVSTLKKANTALLVPNALSIRTARGEKFLFVLLRQREATYQVLKSVCKHLQDKSWNSLSNKEVLRKSRTSSQSDLEQSTPEPDSLQDLPDGLIPMPRQAKEEDEEDEEAAALALNSRGSHTALWAWITAQLSSRNTIILIYLLLMVALLLSSGYLGLRIVELEQQLESMGAWPDPKHLQQ
ncbi:GRAM domain-containing protein 2A-like isoform X2 [Falco peregrinus]|uniref:GRAM domain-containing protein 2A-like isoform X2 n=1 Tax=Falco peregrinus TaxID=8954 RepID=UPI00247A932F|nr:GRAM domain-containing protein 2A-like isoform X2 [Falco peregrinus]